MRDEAASQISTTEVAQAIKENMENYLHIYGYTEITKKADKSLRVTAYRVGFADAVGRLPRASAGNANFNRLVTLMVTRLPLEVV